MCGVRRPVVQCTNAGVRRPHLIIELMGATLIQSGRVSPRKIANEPVATVDKARGKDEQLSNYEGCIITYGEGDAEDE